MDCLYCGGDTKVVNSRPQKRLNHIWRRRQCLGCRAIFTTSEAPELISSLLVQKPAALETFSRDKLFLSIYEACRHRKTVMDDAQALASTIIAKLLPQAQNATLASQNIVETAAATLKRFDKAAHVHYTAYHPQLG